jgi:hypothetical protein
MHGLPDAPEPTGSIYVSTYPWTILPLYSCLMAYPECGAHPANMPATKYYHSLLS